MWNIDLVVCDEGHRLKNTEIQTSKSVKMLKAPRRVILSGTPIQVTHNIYFLFSSINIE